MPLSFVRQDITKLAVDAIVNAANTKLAPGGGVCGAIFDAAGYRSLDRACRQIGRVSTGDAVATPGFRLPARYIIHTAGPVWQGGGRGERTLLENCYRNSLELAASLGCRSIAFPLISSGIYGYPRAEAFSVAVSAIRTYLEDDPDMEVTLCLFNREATTLAEGLFGQVERYIDDQYVEESPYLRREANEYTQALADAERNAQHFGAEKVAKTASPAPRHQSESPSTSKKGFALPWTRKRHDDGVREQQAPAPASAPAAAPHPSAPAPSPDDTLVCTLTSLGGATASAFGSHSSPSLDELLTHLDASFADTLLAMIDERGLTDAQVYGRANLSRQYFSKLRSGSVNPSKRVVCALAVALGLDLGETRLLLERAGHALTHASRFDIIVEWFIASGSYDVFEINQALFRFDQPLLGTS